MAEEYISIPELNETVVVDNPDFLVIRQGVVDRKVSLGNFRDGILSAASTSAAGIVQLNDAINSTSLSEAATANAAKKAYDRGSQALTAANSAISGLSGKANTAHTHTASNITTGTFVPGRLPWAQLNSIGIVRPTDNLALSSSASYSPSIESVRSIKQQADGIQSQIDALELGTAFTPIPSTQTNNTELTSFPIGTTLLVHAGVGFVPRANTRSIRLTTSGTRDVSSYTPGSHGSGRYHIDGFPGTSGPLVPGLWACRGSYSPIWRAGDWLLRSRRNSDTTEGLNALQNCVLMQKIAD